MAFGDADILSILRDLGVDATVNGNPVRVLIDYRSEDVVEGETTSGMGQEIIIYARADQQGAVGDSIVVGASSFIVTDLVMEGDGAVVGAVCERTP